MIILQALIYSGIFLSFKLHCVVMNGPGVCSQPKPALRWAAVNI